MRKFSFKSEPRSRHYKRQDDEGDQKHHKKKHGKHPKANKDDGTKDKGSSQSGDSRDPSAQSPNASSAAKAAQPASAEASVPPSPPTQGESVTLAGSAAPTNGDGQRTSLPAPAVDNDVRSAQASPAGTGLSVEVLSAAISGGVVLLLVLLGVIVLWRKRRRNAVQKAGSAPDLRLKIGPPEIPGEKSVNDTAHAMDRGTRQLSQTSLQHGHVSLPMAHAQQSEFTLVDGERSKWPACNDSAAQLQRSDSCRSELQQESLSGRPELLPENGWDNIRAASPYDGDEKEIDRCLSYYMKRSTRVSLPPVELAELAEGGEPSMLEDNTSSLPPSPVVNRMSTRKSFVFPKTAGLLAKIRKSQIRLNNEALAIGSHNDHPLPVTGFSLDHGNGSSRLMSSTMPDSGAPTRGSEEHESTFESLSLGRAGPDIPSHWRSSTRLRRSFAGDRDGNAAIDSSPSLSEPHPAFEYNDSYENHTPAAHGSPWLGVGLGDGYDCYSATWQDRSPCRSSALSPRRSMTSTVRQRSATFSQCAPSRSPLFQENDADGAHAASPMSARHLSQEANDVIRF